MKTLLFVITLAVGLTFPSVSFAQAPNLGYGSQEAYNAIAKYSAIQMIDSYERKRLDAKFEASRQRIAVEIQQALVNDPKAEKLPILRKVIDESESQKGMKLEKLERDVQRLKADLLEMKRGKVSQNPDVEKRVIDGGQRRSSGKVPILDGMSYANDRLTRTRHYFLFTTAKSKKNNIDNQVKELAKVNDEIKRCRDKNYVYVPKLSIKAIAINKIGQLYFPEEIILKRGEGEGFVVTRIIDDKSMLVSIQGKTCLVKGVSTVGVIDDSKVLLTDLFHVSGTKQLYSQTVLVLEAIHFPSNNNLTATVASDTGK